MNELANTITTAVLTGVAAIITAAISFGVAKLTAWLKSKTKSEKLQETIDHTLGFVEDLVILTNQTYVEELKNKNLFDKDAQRHAFTLTYEKAKSMISTEGRELLEAEFGSLESWLTALIESKVVEVKELLQP